MVMQWTEFKNYFLPSNYFRTNHWYFKILGKSFYNFPTIILQKNLILWPFKPVSQASKVRNEFNRISQPLSKSWFLWIDNQNRTQYKKNKSTCQTEKNELEKLEFIQKCDSGNYYDLFITIFNILQCFVWKSV
jgi:hypothetical protein